MPLGIPLHKWRIANPKESLLDLAVDRRWYE
jgi:hypothetical protein